MSDLVMYSGLVRIFRGPDDKDRDQDLVFENFPATGESNARNFLSNKALAKVRELGYENGRAMILDVWKIGDKGKKNAWDVVSQAERGGSKGLATVAKPYVPAIPKPVYKPFSCNISARCAKVFIGTFNSLGDTYNLTKKEEED